jgi:hypothetical protein
MIWSAEPQFRSNARNWGSALQRTGTAGQLTRENEEDKGFDG